MKNQIKFYVLIFILIFSCKNKKETETPVANGQISDSLKLTRLQKDEKKYLLKNEIDSILENWSGDSSDFKYRQKFFDSIKNRRRKISKYFNSPYNHHGRLPPFFQTYIIEDEKEIPDNDTVKHKLGLINLAESRKAKINELVTHPFYLTDEEIHQFIKDSFQNASYFDKISSQRNNKRLFIQNKRADSLKSIVYPIDSTIPFGSQTLLESINNGTKAFEFAIQADKPVTDTVILETRKKIFDIWQYYEKLVFNVPDIEPHGYFPRVETHEFLSLNNEQNEDDNLFYESTDIDPSYQFATFELRLENIGVYEIYLNIMGPNYHCNFENVEDCCFYLSNECDTEGYLTFYDRKKKDAKTINIFFINGAYTAFRFFTINKDKSISLFSGVGRTNKAKFNGNNLEGTLTFESNISHNIHVSDDGEIIIKKDEIAQ